MKEIIKKIVLAQKSFGEEFHDISLAEEGPFSNTTNYWDGYSDCTDDILKKIESIEEEPVSEDLKKFEQQYMKDNEGEIVSVIDRHAGIVDGANWQKRQIMNDGVEGICISVGSECGSVIESPAGTLFLQLDKFNKGDKVKIIIIKEN